jgi:hypothetical protein
MRRQPPGREKRMSDRTPGSVRTGSRGGDDAAPESPRPEGSATAQPVSATQSIPTTGTVRAQAAGAPAAAPARPGTPPAAGPAKAPTGQQPQTAGPTRPAGAAAGRPAAAPAKGRGKAGRGPRRARLQLRHIDIWSAFKISLVLSIVMFFIWMVAIAILYAVLNSLGVFSTINDLFGQLGSASGQASAGTQVVTSKVVFIGAAVIGAVNVILWTALCTVATFIYNMCADLVGGLEVTLSERD